MQARVIREERRGDVPLFVQPEWAERYPWLVQGTTGRAAGDFASWGSQSAEAVQRQWRRLRQGTGMSTAVLGRQVHGAQVLEHAALSAGTLFTDDADGHVTRATGVLLAVSVADCVPVFVVDPVRRVVAALHAGWRGTAAQIVAACLAMVGSDVDIHLGPAICGDCYEVGPEVHEALGLPRPERNIPVDVRSVLVDQCARAGVSPDRITRSAWCTRCGDSQFFSHRALQPERQLGVIGIR